MKMLCLLHYQKVAYRSFLFELELKEYFDMTISKTHIIFALMTKVLFVKESRIQLAGRFWLFY